MLKILKYIGIGLGVLVALIVLAGVVLKFKSPKSQPASTEVVQVTPERVARGAYLFNAVSGCSDCHTARDYGQYGGPIANVALGSGTCWPKEFNFPNVQVCPPNITSDKKYGVGAWTDGELIRAIREGVGRDGRTLFPMMPYSRFKEMSDEDVRSVVAYLRTLPPSDHQPQPTEVGIPFSLVEKLFPEPVKGKVTAPAATDHVAYGKYLVNLAGCTECHGDDFSGGNDFDAPSGKYRSANLTPDPATGLKLSREEFIGRFKALENMSGPSKPGHEVMDWLVFAKMTPDDLGDIYDYLRTLKPVKKAVVQP